MNHNEARIKTLREFLAQAGKRLSKDSKAKINDVIAKLSELVGDDDEEAADQQAITGQMLLAQGLQTGISVATTYEALISKVQRALRRDSSLPGDYRYSFYTDPEWVAFTAYVYDEAVSWEDRYKTYIADYTDNDDGNTITFSNVRECSIEQIIVVIGTEDEEADYDLTQAQSIQPEVYMLDGANGGGMLLQMVRGSVQFQKKSDGRYQIQGVAVHGNVPNQWEVPVVFPTELFASQLATVQAMIAQGKAIGCLGHPTTPDGKYREPEAQEYCIKFTKLEQNGDLFPFTAVTTTNQAGKEFAALLDDGVNFDMSTVTLGKVKKQDWQGQEMNVVQPENFQWVRIADVVLDGASPGAEITDVRLQAINAEPGSEETMNPEEVKKLIQELLDAKAAGDTVLIQSLQAKLEDITKSLEQHQGAPALTDEQTKLLEQAAEIIAERDAARSSQARDAKVTEVVAAMVQAKEIPDQYAAVATGLFQGHAANADQVETVKPVVLAAMKPMLDVHADLQSKGIYTPEYNEDGTKKGKIDSLAQGVEELLDSAEVRGLIPKYERESLPYQGVNGERLRDFGNMRQNLLEMTRTLVQQHPEIGAAYFQLRNGQLKNVQQSVDIMSQAGAQALLQATGDGTLTTDIAAALPYVLPMMLEIYPQLVANMFATMQPLSNSSGRIYYWDHRYDDDDSAIDDVANFTGSYANSAGEIEQVKYINMDLTSEDVTTDDKKLGWKASIKVLRNLQADFGIDGRSDLVRMCAALIAMEWNYNQLCEIIDGAGAGNVNYGVLKPTDSSFDGDQWQRQAHRFLQKARGLVWKKTFADTYAIFGDSDSIDRIIDATEKGQYIANGRGSIARGVDIVGSLSSGEQLVKVGWLDTLRANKLVICGRGSNWPETGYVIAPFLGLYVTPEWVNPDTQQAKQSMLSQVANKMVQSNYFATMTIQPETNGTPF